MAGEPLVVVGSGGFGRETAAAVRALVDRDDGAGRWDLLGFVDDDPGRHGRLVDGVPVLGGVDALADLPDARVVVTTGHPGDYTSRARLVDRLGLPPERYATVVHPAASVPHGAALGPGTVLLAGVVLTTPIVVGAHVAVMPGTVLTHDDQVGDYVTCGAGVLLAGRVRVGTGAYLGAGARVNSDRHVGPWALVGMGAVVLDDVPAGEVWAGVPARRRRAVDLPDGLPDGPGAGRP